jgi:26S proteasome regulatory subunit N1
LLYGLAPAMHPRMLVTFDEDLKPLPVSVRVGQVIATQIGHQLYVYNYYINFFFLKAVDVVGQAGKPKTITGFQTHTTPVLLAAGERAELATEEYLPLTPIMEVSLPQHCNNVNNLTVCLLFSRAL